MRMVIGTVLVLFLAGCGTGMTQTTVGGTAREKCRAVGYDDGFIDSAFIRAEASKAEGASLLEMLAAGDVGCELSNCPDMPCVWNCQDCQAAILNEVYD